MPNQRKQTEAEREASAKSLAKRARDEEQQWRNQRGLDEKLHWKRMHRCSDAKSKSKKDRQTTGSHRLE